MWASAAACPVDKGGATIKTRATNPAPKPLIQDLLIQGLLIQGVLIQGLFIQDLFIQDLIQNLSVIANPRFHTNASNIAGDFTTKPRFSHR
ncbi:MAG TPA: hypothetical protein VFA80_18360 [Xanthobacteraceae bacterium]|nr:hypothetical protein [Xanthobacteraceae bacterium]